MPCLQNTSSPSLVNLSHLTFHHANSTQQVAEGITPKVVSGGLGHSNLDITLDLYSHVLPNIQRHAADAVANLLKRERKSA